MATASGSATPGPPAARPPGPTGDKGPKGDKGAADRPGPPASDGSGAGDRLGGRRQRPNPGRAAGPGLGAARRRRGRRRTGTYAVVFSHDVTDCAYQASIGRSGTERRPSSPASSPWSAGPTNANGVFVQTSGTRRRARRQRLPPHRPLLSRDPRPARSGELERRPRRSRPRRRAEPALRSAACLRSAAPGPRPSWSARTRPAAAPRGRCGARRCPPPPAPAGAARGCAG